MEFRFPPLVADRPRIEEVLREIDVLAAMERAFVALSRGSAVLGPVGELLLPERSGEVHLKYGWLRGAPFYVVKVASGFYDNPPEVGSSNGLMLVFDASSGAIRSVLLDEGHLTDVRTAAAGALAARVLARPEVVTVGVLGSGRQARLQLEWLREVVSTRECCLWARCLERAESCARDLGALGWRVEILGSADEVASSCDLLVTTTASRQPLFDASSVRLGTHVTAVGSDTKEKQELPPDLLARADRVVTDSRLQCSERGEISHALGMGAIGLEEVAELGEILSGSREGRDRSDEITIADLTGVAVQDIEIALAVQEALIPNPSADVQQGEIP